MYLVYYELQGDIFGSMYAGEEGFSGMTLTRLLQAFPSVGSRTVFEKIDRFSEMLGESIFSKLPTLGVL